MSRVVELEVSRKVFATVLVEVPDDVTDKELMYAVNTEAVNAAVFEQVDSWDEWNNESTTEVESAGKPDEVDGYPVTDITEKLYEIKRRNEEARRRFLEEQETDLSPLKTPTEKKG